MGLLALPGLLLAPPGPPLDADVFDASALPTVTIDIVAPHDVAAVDLTAPMVQISGGSVQSVAKVEPSSVAISLVIDDGPTLTPEAVTESQGASVELVRNTGDGTQISLSTPSGLQTAPTVDRDANIARISGIVAGAPDVVALPNLLIDAATRLAAMPTPDRHLVLVIGTTFPETTAVQSLRDVIIPARIRLDVVAATGLDPGPIDDLAIESGGLSPVLPKPVGEMDAVTEAIRDRYHVTGTVDGPGTHNVTLNVDGRTFAAQVEVPDAPPPPVAAAASTTAVTPTTVAAASPTQTQTRTRTRPTAGTPRSVATPTTSASSDDDGASSGMSRGARIVVVLLALVAAAAFGTFVVLSQRAKAAAGLRRARAAGRAAEGGEGGEDDGADVVSADAPSVWDRPPDLPSAEPEVDTGAA